jgi:hypothetical protein
MYVRVKGLKKQNLRIPGIPRHPEIAKCLPWLYTARQLAASLASRQRTHAAICGRRTQHSPHCT